MNIFLVTSPFQYICANEAKEAYNTKENILVLVNHNSEPGLSQQKKLVDYSEWDHVIITKRKNRSKNMPKVIKNLLHINKKGKIEHFFHAEYNGWRTKLMLRNLPIEKEVYFDDGTLTINEYEEFIRPKINYFRPRLIQDLIIRLRGCQPIGNLPQSENLELFTIFNIIKPEHPVQKNTFQALKKQYKINSLYHPNAPIGFIGQGSIGHKGHKKVDVYINEVLHFSNHFKKEIIYFPHRTESEYVRQRIMQIDKITYHHSELPLEIELVDKKIHLAGLVGILSTVQYTALMLYPNMPIFNLVDISNLEHTPKKLILKRENRIKRLFEENGIKNIAL